jgi:hypothetical protein
MAKLLMIENLSEGTYLLLLPIKMEYKIKKVVTIRHKKSRYY